MNCGMYRIVKLLEHAMKIVEDVLDISMRKVIAINDVQFGSMRGKDTNDAVIILRRIQEEYLAKQKKLYMCFVDLEKAFDKVPCIVMEWAMRNKGIPEALLGATMSLYIGAKSKLKVWKHLS